MFINAVKPPSNMLVQKELTYKLRDFGLNSYESKLWAALLSKGAATAGELSDAANVPRSRSYDVLESLEKKGFVIMKIGKPIKYVALPPEHVLDNVRKRIAEDAQIQDQMLTKIKTSDVFGELTSLYSTGVEKVDPADHSGIVRGRRNIQHHLEKVMKSASKSIVIQSSSKGIPMEAALLKAVTRKVKRAVKIMVTVPTSSDTQLLVKEASPQVEIRSAQIQGRFYIIDEKELIFLVAESDSGNQAFESAIWVRSPFFVSGFSRMFLSSWNSMSKN
jgi:HTH-type transcriptional regulator, sugar sensing transcriptional regulator